MDVTGTLEEAYERLHRTGPEFDGWLSNHGPMAVESMVRRGHARRVHRWLDAYTDRLEELPGSGLAIGDDWQVALGDARRLGDWLRFFERELTERPWRGVLAEWWPRLLPGIAAGATHGVIRTGHAVHALLELTDPPHPADPDQKNGPEAAGLRQADGPGARLGLANGPEVAGLGLVDGPEAAGLGRVDGPGDAALGRVDRPGGAGLELPDGPRVAELGQALGYWAARWQPVAGVSAPTGTADPAGALAGVPRVPDQSAGINHRLGQLGGTGGWESSVAALAPAPSPAEARDRLAALADAATSRYLTHAHGSPVMLIHSATAPTAVLRTLPALPGSLWAPSLHAAWAAAAAVTAAYGPAGAADRQDLPAAPESAQEAFERAVGHGDEHVIKLADTALDVYDRTGDPDALAAVLRASTSIQPLTS